MNSFYCQGRIEDDTACETQCDHCREYYKPLAGEGWEESWKAVNKQLPCGVNRMVLCEGRAFNH